MFNVKGRALIHGGLVPASNVKRVKLTNLGVSTI